LLLAGIGGDVSEPTPGKVSRALDRFRADVHADFEDLRRDMRDGMAGVKVRIIFRDVYDADELRRHGELQVLRDALKALTDSMTAERQIAQAWWERRGQNRKWLIAAVILPICGVLVEVINLLRSAHMTSG
jgi:hypothetical protein